MVIVICLENEIHSICKTINNNRVLFFNFFTDIANHLQ